MAAEKSEGPLSIGVFICASLSLSPFPWSSHLSVWFVSATPVAEVCSRKERHWPVGGAQTRNRAHGPGRSFPLWNEQVCLIHYGKVHWDLLGSSCNCYWKWIIWHWGGMCERLWASIIPVICQKLTNVTNVSVHYTNFLLTISTLRAVM